MLTTVFESDANLVTIRSERCGAATLPEPAPDCAIRLTIQGSPDPHLLREMLSRWTDEYAVGR